MILKEHANKLVTNVQNETQNFGIGDVSGIINILRNQMYEHKIRTLVQEYICNARDAVREVGKGNKSVEVTMPTELSPVFKVKDFGPGISPDRMSNVFILYGATTKRDTNSQTGGFGIGAKSAWSYTDSFAILSVVDGVKRSYVAHIGVNNNGRLDLVSTEKTTEQNGTEIQIAVKRIDVSEFRDAVMRAIYFWEVKPVLKGNLDAPTLTSGFRLGNTLEIIESKMLPHYVDKSGQWNNSALAVIDGIPYSINDAMLQKCPVLHKLVSFTKRKIILHIDNGVLEIAATRESITDKDRNKAALETLANKTFLQVKTHIADQFGAVGTVHEYINTYQKLNGMFQIERGFAKYKDYQIDSDNLDSPLLKLVKITKIHCLARYGRAVVKKITKEDLEERHKTLPLQYFKSLFYINAEESLITQNKRIRAHFDTGVHVLYLIQPIPGKETEYKRVVKDLDVKNFQSIQFVVLPKEQRVRVTREKTEFCIHTLEYSVRHKYTTLADNTDTWLYLPLDNAYELQDLKDLHAYLRDTYKVRVCQLSDAAIKMVDGDVNFTPFSEWLDNFTPSKKELNHTKLLKAANKSRFENLVNATGIKDKAMVRLAEEYKEFTNGARIEVLPKILLKKANAFKEVIEFIKSDEAMEESFKKDYPLMDSFSSYYSANKALAQELVVYLNAKFKEKK